MKGRKPHMKADPEAIIDLAPPGFLSKSAKAEWRRVMPILASRKILTTGDLGSLENYCIAMGMVKDMEAELQKKGIVIETENGLKRHPAVGIQSDAMTRARLLAAELGLTPVSRSRPIMREIAEDDDSLLD